MQIEIFGRAFPLYGLCCALGGLLAGLVAFFIGKKRKSTKADIFDFTLFVLYLLAGVMIGAKLLFLAVSIKDIIYTVKIIGFTWEFIQGILMGGWVFYGGFIGGAIGVILYCRSHKKPLMDYLNLCAVVVPLGHGFGRIGCFFGGCCYGMEYDGWLSYSYKAGIGSDHGWCSCGYADFFNQSLIGVPRLPVQLIEATCLFILFGIMLFLYFKASPKLDIWLIYLASYSILRFILEFFRGDAERGVALLSTSQWISIGLMAIAIGVFIYKWKKGMYKFRPAMVDEENSEPVEEKTEERPTEKE